MHGEKLGSRFFVFFVFFYYFFSFCHFVDDSQIRFKGTTSLVVEVGKAVAGVARTNRASAMRLRMRRRCTSNLGPAHFEETAHPVSGLPDGTVVLVEYLAVDEHLPDISAKLISRLVHGVLQFLLNRTEIHGGFYDFLVGRELFGVHRQKERPRLVLLLQLFEKHLTRSQLSLLLLRECPIVSLLPWRGSRGCRFR